WFLPASFRDAERARWDYATSVVDSGAQGLFYEHNEFLKEKSFAAVLAYMKQFILSAGFGYPYGGPNLDQQARDADIPYTPIINYTGVSGFPINALTFQTSTFSDPQGSNTFAAMKWRIAEVNPGSEFVPPPQPQEETIVLIQDGDTWKYFKGTREPSQTSGLWRRLSFSDSSWLQGDAPIGYGESFIATDLSDMRGNYSTLYLRKTFDVADIDSIETLRLDALYDDGINVWINGVNVASDNVSSAELPYNAVTDNRPENHEFTSFTLPDPNSYLVSGTNIIAVQVVNQSLGDSSDCFIDVRLVSQSNVAVELPTTPVNYVREPGKYEIDAVWESDELTTFNSTVGIPASAVKVGSIYRVRCRMKDNTGRWSHWSNPVQFSSLVNW
ncbi:MAG: hypothetical protein MUP16_07980, partial [Sedimentisphaerales bacterium]|nr:hypothetical protein [Sedimentisphaerales bacterium]